MRKSFYVAALLSAIASPSGVAAALTGNEVVERCRHQPSEKDEKGVMSLTITNKTGNVTKQREFLYLRKYYNGVDDLWSKFILFTLAPPGFKDNGYLRWEYTMDTGKLAEQWVYVHKTRRVDRLSKRDPRDMTFGLVAEDLQIQQWRRDTHTLVRTEELDDVTIFWVESLPQGADSRYAKMVTRFKMHNDWQTCRHWRTEFFDKAGKRRKEVTSNWLQKGDIWYNSSIIIKSDKLLTTTVYEFKNVEFNNAFKDDAFTPRRLPQAIRYTRMKKP